MEKMRAYNEEWLKNLEIQETAETWHDQGLVTDEQLKSINQAYPQGFYRPNIFLRIGLFIFGSIACGFMTSILSLMIMSVSYSNMGNENHSIAVISLLNGIILLFALEFTIRNIKTLYSGIDNMLLYGVILSYFCFILYIRESDYTYLQPLTYCFLMLPILVIATIRYAEIVVGIAAYLCVLAIVVLIMMKFPIGKMMVPFVVMIFAGLSYWVLQIIKKKDNLFYYKNLFSLLEICCTVLFYLGGNYLIVREGNAMLNDLHAEVSPEIAFAPLFYFFTFVIPILYVVLGLRRYDRKLLIIGILAFGFSIFTYRQYHSIMPLPWALTLGGFLMILVSILAIRYLKTPRRGVTYQALVSDKNRNLESIVLGQMVGQIPGNPQGDFQFGGGESGGGGAEGNY
jgi:hypothetical protein